MPLHLRSRGDRFADEILTMLLALVAPLAAVLTPTPMPKPATACTRAALLHTSTVLCSSLLLAGRPLSALAEDAAPTAAVMDGVLQMQEKLAATVPAGSTATVQIRVVGRNTKGPLATVNVPLEGKTFPVSYTVTKADLREGVADFIWEAEDIYVKADVVTPAGKTFGEGRSKSKFKDGVHQTAFLTVE